jgi:SAM-dependent methyltransferase
MVMLAMADKIELEPIKLLDKQGLDAYHEQLREGQIADAWGGLVIDLFKYRAEHSTTNWESFVTDTVRKHPICEFMYRDPFTHRSFIKPRGYAGDAVMLDMIYLNHFRTDDPIANTLLAYARSRPAPCAIKSRLRTLASHIDEAMLTRPNARILALAAGHLREIELTESFNGKFDCEIVALDQDAESLAVVERDYAGRCVHTLHASIRHLLAGKLDLRGFDLVYAAGLLDYLTQPIAAALCQRMFAMLNPGGRMLVANFVPDIPDVGYMESFMDWQLIYRDEATMRDLAASLPRERIEASDVWLDDTRNIVYLTVKARG